MGVGEWTDGQRGRWSDSWMDRGTDGWMVDGWMLSCAVTESQIKPENRFSQRWVTEGTD